MRSVLTTLGIIIGIVTVTPMGTAIDGLNRAFHDSISILGADVLFVSRITWADRTYEQWLNENKRRDITREQARRGRTTDDPGLGRGAGRRHESDGLV